MSERVVVFVDYQNVFRTARQGFHDPPHDVWHGQVDPLRVGDVIVGRRRRPCRLSQVRVYRGLPSVQRQPTAHAANERQAGAWQAHGVHTVRRPLRYPPRWPDEPAQEKGIDVALAIDVVRLALEGAYDVGVVFSTDTDLLPALEVARDVGVHIEVAAWWGARCRARLNLGRAQPWCHRLGREDYVVVRDVTDYRTT